MTLPRLVIQRAKEVLGDRFEAVEKALNRAHVSYLIEHPNINRKFDIPYLAGSNDDGGKTYIDKRLPKFINIDGKKLDPSKYLNIHEQIEHALMEELNLPYAKAHFIAEAYERSALEKDGFKWMDYEHVLDGYIDEIEHEKIKTAPDDLYKKPYCKSLKNKLSEHSHPVKNRLVR